jgi:hypothetical protein
MYFAIVVSVDVDFNHLILIIVNQNRFFLNN